MNAMRIRSRVRNGGLNSRGHGPWRSTRCQATWVMTEPHLQAGLARTVGDPNRCHIEPTDGSEPTGQDLIEPSSRHPATAH